MSGEEHSDYHGHIEPTEEIADQETVLFYTDTEQGNIIEIVLTLLIILIGVPGNLLVVVSVGINKQLRSTPYYFTFNLAVGDLLVTLLCCPFQIYAVIAGGWKLSDELCKVLAVVLTASLRCTFFTLALVAVNRYIFVTQSPRIYRKIFGRFAAMAMILLSWALSLFFTLEPHMNTHDYGYNTHYGICLYKSYGGMVHDEDDDHHHDEVPDGNDNATTDHDRPPTIDEILDDHRHGTHIIPGTIQAVASLIILLAYLAIYIHLQKSRAKISLLSSSNFAGRINKKNLKLIKNLFLIVCVFFVFTTPFCLTEYFVDSLTVASSPHSQATHYFLYRIPLRLLLFNCCVNPLLYAWKQPLFRKTFIHILCRRKLERRTPSMEDKSHIKVIKLVSINTDEREMSTVGHA